MNQETNTRKLAIIGGGPAGMTASIYASRYKVTHLIVSPIFGGAAREAHQIENWPGIPQIKGSDLMDRMWEHAKSYNPEILKEEIKGVLKTETGFRILTSKGKEIDCLSIIFAGGTQHNRLTIPGEQSLLGRGVSYCATCDGTFFKGKNIAVVGGANSAIMAAMELSQHVNHIYLVFRGTELKGEPIWIDRVMNNEKITLVPSTNLLSIEGNGRVEKIKLDKLFDGKNEISLEGVFIEIGVTPLVDIIKDLKVNLDNIGNVIVDAKGNTNIPGLFAAGDATTGSGGFRQIITASAEGAIASRSAFEYLKEKGE